MLEALIFLAGAACGALAYHYLKPKQKAPEPTAQTKGAGGPGPIDPTKLP